MFVYSKKIILFVQEIKSTLKGILSREAHLKVAADRFYDRWHAVSYPIRIVIYNNKSMLGYFDSNFYELGFHECLMHSSQGQLHNVIRHELAHYLTFIKYGNIQPHGAEFREICKKMGWGEEVYQATTCLDDGRKAPEMEESSIFRKVQKLMALANSSNKNEAEQAMIKSQQLLLKHNLESKYMDKENDEKIFVKRILKQKRENAKMRSIAIILETFFVSPIYRRTDGFIYLEILGDGVNIEIAEHVAIVLDRELDNLWSQAQQLASLKGMIAKNSFFLGIAKGYCNKIQALKREYHAEVKNGLMVIEKKLMEAKALVYQRLSSNRSKGSYCRDSSALGEKMGSQLNINPAIKSSSNTTETLIGYSS
jgi:hypothetical protein